ncbi:GC-rich sequence DNA-binding factor [Cricetulus griseus]|uniref:GC-rich sequence DNA-binding factor n=1 Tax=Cricetulus griseus TaxID=10029 RepID=G3H0P5_CRIGR|nr:GC-rich sequence DNA-binding factor [Cricetulus griseus]
MALRPQRTFRRRQVESSDSDGDGAEERPAEVPADAGRPSAGGRAEGAEPPRRARGNRGRGRVWASSRRSPGTASRRDRGAVKIPDAAFIQEARRKRELARTPGDYISLDVNHPSTTCDNKRSNEEDPESDPDDYEKRILFAPKPQTLRQRMAEETSFRNEEESEDSQEDENQDIWEQQQMRKAVKIRELDSMALNQMPWFTSITEFMDGSSEDPREEDGSDKKMLSAVINKTVVPRLADDTLQDLGLGKLLNRYLIIALTNAIPGPDAVKKCSQIAACLPEKWFENSAMRTSIPQLENFIQFLLQSAHKLSTGEFRNEVNEIILILVKVKALNQAESLREEHHLEPPISPISGV